MANPHRGQVTLQAGDTAYTLSFSVNALCVLEEELDMPVAKVATAMNDPETVRLSLIRAVVWGALQDHHPEIDLAAAGSIASEAGIAATMEAVGRAFHLAFPEAGEGADQPDPQKAGAKSTGSRTSKSGRARAATRTASGG